MVPNIRPKQSRSALVQIILCLIITMLVLVLIGDLTRHSNSATGGSGAGSARQLVGVISHEGGAGDGPMRVEAAPENLEVSEESEGLAAIVDSLLPVGNASADDGCDGVNPQPNPDCVEDPTATPTSTPTATATPGND